LVTVKIMVEDTTAPIFLVAFNIHTAGVDGDNLGSDEAECIHIAWVVVDYASTQVCGFAVLFSLGYIEPYT
jgi:hypothetical protein